MPYRYKIEQMVAMKSLGEYIDGKREVLTAAECKALDQLLGLDNPTLDEQAQIAELTAKLYPAFLPPPSMVVNIRPEVSERIKRGRPRDPAEQREYDIAEAEAVAQWKAREEKEARAQAQYEQSPQGQFTAWLRSVNLGYTVKIFDDNAVDVTMLSHLTHDMLKGLGINWLGDRIKLLNYKASAQLQKTDEGDEMYDADGQLKS